MYYLEGRCLSGWRPNPLPLAGSILRRWKRNWFVLWLDGGLVYYRDETQRDMEGRIHIRFNCRDIKTGRECRGERIPLEVPLHCAPHAIYPLASVASKMLGELSILWSSQGLIGAVHLCRVEALLG